MIRRSAAALVAVAALACPAAAGAAPSWLAPATPFDQPGSLELTTAMAPDGTAMIARVRGVGSAEALEAVVRRPGGQLSAPVEVARTAPARHMVFPQAWAGPDGGFAITFYDGDARGNPGSDATVAVLRSDGSVADRFTAPKGRIAPPALDSRGRLYFVTGTETTLAVVERAAAASRTIDVPLPPIPEDGRLGELAGSGVTPDGRLVVAYVLSYEKDDCAQVSELWVNRGTGQAFGAPTKVASRVAPAVKVGGGCQTPDGQVIVGRPGATIDAQGEVTLVFGTRAYGGTALTGRALHGHADGAWAPEETIGATTGSSGTPGVWLAGSRPTATFVSRIGLSSLLIEWSTRNPDGTWSTPQIVARTGTLLGFSMAPVGDGSSVFAWLDDADTTRLLARRAAPGTALEEPTVVASGLAAPQAEFSATVAVGGDVTGNAIAVFATGGERTARYAGFDGVAPVIEGASIPGAAVAGVPGTFSAVVRDVWSTVTPVWSFSDGGSGTGGSVAHAFGAPGRFTATVRATDDAGNTATASGPVDVAAAAPTAAAAVRDTTAPAFTTKPAVRGTAIAFALSEPAKVVATVTRAAKGVRKGKRCVAPPKRKTKARTCTRQVKVATLRGTFKAGTGKLALPAKVRRTKGIYTITLAITDGAGNVTTSKLTYRVTRTSKKRGRS